MCVGRRGATCVAGKWHKGGVISVCVWRGGENESSCLWGGGVRGAARGERVPPT